MENLVMRVVEKELQKLNVNFTILNRKNGRIRLNLTKDENMIDIDLFMKCYDAIRDKVNRHPQYDGFEHTCQNVDGGVIFLPDSNLFFNYKNKANPNYEFILNLVSEIKASKDHNTK